MGYAIAEVARNRGAQVTLISTVKLPTPVGVALIAVESALQMKDAVLSASAGADVLVMASAVADFRPNSVADQKIKKKGKEEGLSLTLARNPDILVEVANQREAGMGPRVTVGFAAETQDLLNNARGKLERKKLDFIAANDVSATDAGFAVDTNRVTLLGVDGTVTELPLMSKIEVAEAIFDAVQPLFG